MKLPVGWYQIVGMTVISPAQCGGLIEASGCRAAASPIARDFPRAMRGPH